MTKINTHRFAHLAEQIPLSTTSDFLSPLTNVLTRYYFLHLRGFVPTSAPLGEIALTSIASTSIFNSSLSFGVFFFSFFGMCQLRDRPIELPVANIRLLEGETKLQGIALRCFTESLYSLELTGDANLSFCCQYICKMLGLFTSICGNVFAYSMWNVQPGKVYAKEFPAYSCVQYKRTVE